MQLAGGDGDGVAVLAVDVVVAVDAVDGASTISREAAPDAVVLDVDDVVVVVVAHHTGAGFDTDIVALPAWAPSKLACMVPPAS